MFGLVDKFGVNGCLFVSWWAKCRGRSRGGLRRLRAGLRPAEIFYSRIYISLVVHIKYLEDDNERI